MYNNLSFQNCSLRLCVSLLLSNICGVSSYLLRYTAGIFLLLHPSLYFLGSKFTVESMLTLFDLYISGLLKVTVGVLTTCHTQYTWDRSICIFFNRTTLHVFVTYFTGALYVHHLWFYKHQHDNRVRSTQNAFSLPFAATLVNCAPSREMHNYCTRHTTKENFENFLIHRCDYILLSQVYCAWQVVKTATIILNNPVFLPLTLVSFAVSTL